MLKKTTLVFSAILLVLVASFFGFAAETNLIKNSSFESGGIEPGDWEKKVWDSSGISEFKWETGSGHTGNRFVTISSTGPNHARYSQEVRVQPKTKYKVSCWIKAQNIPGDKKGAGIGVEGVALGDYSLTDTDGNWQLFEVYGETGSNQSSLSLYITLGGYGSLNSGQASFDDVSVEEVANIPAGVQLYSFYQDPGATTVTTNTAPTYTDLFTSLTAAEWILLAIIILAIYIGIAAFYLLYYLPKKETKPTVTAKNGKSKIKPKTKTQPEKLPLEEPAGQKYLNYLYIIIGLGLLFRLILAPLYKGYHFDYGMFSYWSQEAVKYLFSMYHPGKVYIDYPPVYIFALYFVGILTKIFGIVKDTGLYFAALKLPAIIADAATAYILFRLAKNYLDAKKGLIIAALYYFNPVIWFDTVFWGQVDSVFFLLIIAMFLAIIEERLVLAAIILTVSILMKPQGFMFAPVLLFELLKRKDPRTFLVATIAGLVTFGAIALPFTVNNSNPLWLYDLLFKMTDTWKFASANAFNFFALMGANWKEDYQTFFLFTYKTWGDIFIVSVVLFTAYLYWKSKNKFTLLFGALILNMGAFNLSSRMHERYLYPAMIIALFIYIYLQEKRALHIFIGTSITNFLNIFLSFIGVASSSDVDAYASLCRVPANHPLLLITSFLNVVLLIYTVKFTVDVLLKQTEVKPAAVHGVKTNVRSRSRKM